MRIKLPRNIVVILGSVQHWTESCEMADGLWNRDVGYPVTTTSKLGSPVRRLCGLNLMAAQTGLSRVG